MQALFLPALASSTLRLVLFAAAAYPLSHRPWFQLRHAWYVSVAAVTVQLLLNLWLLHREFGRRLEPVGAEPLPSAAGA
jgi:hypothetical protein